MELVVNRQRRLDRLCAIVYGEVIKFSRIFDCVVEVPISCQEVQHARPYHPQGRDQVSVAA